MNSNLLVVHGGGPTAVINSSLYGVLVEAKNHKEINKIYGAAGGTQGILDEKLLLLSDLPQEEIEKLLQTPASAIGTSRTPLYEEEYEKMVEVLKKYKIKYVLFNGGNGTMDTCGKLYDKAKEHGISVIGIPKTIDNDISVTDHCPGFGSAARYIAQTVAEIGQDVKSMPIHVSIIEAMGRNAGWITAASALAKKNDEDAPHLVYLPECPFNEEKFLEDVQRMHERHGGVVVVASEGLKDKDGNPIVKPIFESERAVYFGDVSTHLAQLVIEKLGIKARSEKPGIAGRASISLQSKVDRDEAVQVGKEAVKAALEGKTGVMVGFERTKKNYECKTLLIPIEEVMLNEKIMPKNFINAEQNGITEDFVKWCKPLIGEDLLEFAWFNK
ncbi:6-phosphofructokinase [Alkalibacter saccharofermentans]|uniref:Pyrophosphate--fructose 6-phosphate 1-phosphotransferase n=1 Tax=Alkalibacter saccharofermentans DSM 14828 TaxID=1120975 RepID=A0A1M4U564_9FIRM|nr:6-phosphofructokinase [Alkalibacter saccharofermentans]SHE51882.1 6-phosphofructokinase 1 [Alkalibacter saccharofermentans DSM 14828]